MTGPRPGKPGPKPKADSLTSAPVVGVKLPLALLARIDERAKRDRCSRAEVIRSALAAYVGERHTSQRGR